MCKILGYPKGELAGVNNRQYMSAENAKKIFKAFNWVYKTGRSFKASNRELVRKEVQKSIEATDSSFSRELEHRIIYGDGTVGHIIVKIFIVKDSKGRTVRTYGVNQDITERKRIEKELLKARKMESIGNLADGIAHDFNNILSSIIGYTELALDDVEKGSMLEDSLQEIYIAGKRARDLVKQILAFARQSDEQRKPIKVATVANGVIKSVRRISCPPQFGEPGDRR